MKFVEDYAEAYQKNSTLYGFSVKRLFESATIYIMPMVNPDGVDLVNDVINPNSIAYLNAQNIGYQFPEIPFPSRLES